MAAKKKIVREVTEAKVPKKVVLSKKDMAQALSDMRLYVFSLEEQLADAKETILCNENELTQKNKKITELLSDIAAVTEVSNNLGTELKLALDQAHADELYLEHLKKSLKIQDESVLELQNLVNEVSGDGDIIRAEYNKIPKWIRNICKFFSFH